MTWLTRRLWFRAATCKSFHDILSEKFRRCVNSLLIYWNPYIVKWNLEYTSEQWSHAVTLLMDSLEVGEEVQEDSDARQSTYAAPTIRQKLGLIACVSLIGSLVLLPAFPTLKKYGKNQLSQFLKNTWVTRSAWNNWKSLKEEKRFSCVLKTMRRKRDHCVCFRKEFQVKIHKLKWKTLWAGVGNS